MCEARQTKEGEEKYVSIAATIFPATFLDRSLAIFFSRSFEPAFLFQGSLSLFFSFRFSVRCGRRLLIDLTFTVSDRLPRKICTQSLEGCGKLCCFNNTKAENYDILQRSSKQYCPYSRGGTWDAVYFSFWITVQHLSLKVHSQARINGVAPTGID